MFQIRKNVIFNWSEMFYLVYDLPVLLSFVVATNGTLADQKWHISSH